MILLRDNVVRDENLLHRIGILHTIPRIDLLNELVARPEVEELHICFLSQYIILESVVRRKEVEGERRAACDRFVDRQ